MKIMMMNGPSGVGKTSILLHLVRDIRRENLKAKVGVTKLDALSTGDECLFQRENVFVNKKLSLDYCPEHYYIYNLGAIFKWAQELGIEILLLESAGLCYRCVSFVESFFNVAVLTYLSNIQTPKKLIPVIQNAESIVITRRELVSHAEREVFKQCILNIHPEASILEVNALTGEGIHSLANKLLNFTELPEFIDFFLKYTMPKGVCNLCQRKAYL